jgi:hypothetical protein
LSHPASASIEQPSPEPPDRNPAVQRCCAARDRSLEESHAKKTSDYEKKERAGKAYREAMPDLCGHQNIRDFIACVSYGVITGDVHPIEGPQFFYAAQVAISALRLEPKDKNRPIG